METAPTHFTGLWLDGGDWHGKQFSHELPQYDHDRSPGGTGATPMRHAVVDRNGSSVGVWVPASWSDEQAREALDSNW